MPPKNKAKAAGISASSFFDLKAELSKQEEDFAKNKAAGKGSSIVGGVGKRQEKKSSTIWAHPNKGVSARTCRDIELEAISKPTLESARAALERKAKIYDKLRKGKTGGLNDKQYDALLVDFDSIGHADAYVSDSEDEDESLAIPNPAGDDPIIEYEDEFGRVRTAPRSEVPRHLVPNSGQPKFDEDEDIIIHNPINHFPIYEPTAERVAAIDEAYSEANNPLGVHYDASAEVRAKGAGFYQFSGDEETRRMQMEELKAAREETERARKDGGAEDLKPGEVEGMKPTGSDAQTGAGAIGSNKSRATEKRKRELEERRKVVDAKRRKVKGVGVAEEVTFTASASMQKVPMNEDVPAPTFMAAPAVVDPFAALEAQRQTYPDTGSMEGKTAPTTAAENFLAQLQQEMFNSK